MSNPYRSKLTPELKARFVGAIAWGATMEQAARYVGVSLRGCYTAIKKDDVWATKIENAKERADFAVVKSLFKKAIKGDTRAAIFWLKNRRPEQWRDPSLGIIDQDTDERTELRIVLDGGKAATPAPAEAVSTAKPH